MHLDERAYTDVVRCCVLRTKTATGGGRDCGQGASNPIATNWRKIAGNLRCRNQTSRSLEAATLLHRGYTGHQRARAEQKSNGGKIAKNCEIARIAVLTPRPASACVCARAREKEIGGQCAPVCVAQQLGAPRSPPPPPRVAFPPSFPDGALDSHSVLPSHVASGGRWSLGRGTDARCFSRACVGPAIMSSGAGAAGILLPHLRHIPSCCRFFTEPWTVTPSSLRVLRRVNAF